MRWDDLFSDLTGQALAAADATLDAETAEHARALVGRSRLLDRIRSGGAVRARLGLVGLAGEIEGRLVVVGADWLALATGAGETVVPATALATVRLLPEPPGGPGPGSLDQPLLARTRLVQAIRRLARDRALVHVTTVDGRLIAGTVDRAGHDHLELAEHPGDQPRRRAAVRGVSLVPYSALLCVRADAAWDS